MAKKEKIIIREYASPYDEIKEVEGKIVANVIEFKDADPIRPLIFLNVPGWSIQNIRKQKRIIYYNTTTKMLMKPSDVGSDEASSNDMSTAVQNALSAASKVEQDAGAQSKNNTMALLGAGIFIMSMIFGFLFVYLMVTHFAPSTSSSTTTSTSGLLGSGLVSGVVPKNTTASSSKAHVAIGT